MFGVLTRFRRNNNKKLEEVDPKCEQSIGDTLPLKHQFMMEVPIKKNPHTVESLLLSFGSGVRSEGIRSASSVSTLSSNSTATYELPRRDKSSEDDTASDGAPRGGPLALSLCSPVFYEEEAPPLKDAQYVPTFWSTWFGCCSPSDILPSPELACSSDTRTEKTTFGFWYSDEKISGEDTSIKVAKKRAGIIAWKQRRTTAL